LLWPEWWEQKRGTLMTQPLIGVGIGLLEVKMLGLTGLPVLLGGDDEGMVATKLSTNVVGRWCVRHLERRRSWGWDAGGRDNLLFTSAPHFLEFVVCSDLKS
jgi:hypothetical protein